MKLLTDYRGEIEYTEDDIIRFEDGLYGFEASHDFLLIGSEEPELPFHWLQSVEDEKLVFVITDPFLFVEDYDFELDDLTVKQLNINTVDDIILYSTVIIPEKVEEITVNLKSPLVININDRKAKQVILDGDYSYRYNIFKKRGDVDVSSL